MSKLLEKFELQVPVTSGYLLGNTLRQFAMRGSRTWQVAAYKLAKKEGTFGLSDGYNFSHLELFKGKLVSNTSSGVETEKFCTFVFDGKDYVCGDMTIQNLGAIGAPKIETCLVYASGSRTASQNYDVVKRLCPQDMSDFVVVPSRHSPTVNFTFKIEPYDTKFETLFIEATPGVVSLARESAIRFLTDLHI